MSWITQHTLNVNTICFHWFLHDMHFSDLEGFKKCLLISAELCELWIFYFLTWRKKVLRTMSTGPLQALESNERRGQKSDFKDFPLYWNTNGYEVCNNHIKYLTAIRTNLLICRPIFNGRSFKAFGSALKSRLDACFMHCTYVLYSPSFVLFLSVSAKHNKQKNSSCCQEVTTMFSSAIIFCSMIEAYLCLSAV